jgi:hypothetical protein
VSKDTLLEVIKELQEIIVNMVSDTECEMQEMEPETESEDNSEMDNEMETEMGNESQSPEEVMNSVAKSVDEVVWKGKLDPFDLTKRNFSSKQRERMAEQGHAMPDGSFPIANRTDLMNAIRSWGRGGSDPKVKEHIKRRARALGAQDMIPENWK